jgi:carboxypeptidase PM20D1
VDKPGLFTGRPSEAVVNIGEKGFASFRLDVDMPGGHSSRPPKQNAIETLLKAANRVSTYRFRARLDGPIGDLLSFAGSEAGFWKRLMIANLWLTKPIVAGMLAANPATDCIIRTTAVVTIINAGMKDNVIPSHAEAIVNTRPAFGESPESVMKEIVAAIGDDRVKVTPIGSQVGPSKVAPLDNDQFRMLHKLIASYFDDAVLVPGVLTGGTDTKHYADLTDSIYRFVPVELTHDLSVGVHGINEKIPATEFGRMIAFYGDLMRQASL